MENLNFSPLNKRLIFDSHAHYDDERFKEFSDELYSELSKSVAGIITCGCDYESNLSAMKLAEQHDFVYFAAGIHPCNVDSVKSPETAINQITKFTKHDKCVGIGEIGLDYYWTQETKEKQKEIFSAQLELSKKLDLPVIVHDRDAHADTLEYLKKYQPRGVVHSFSGSVQMAEEIYKIGMYIGISGVITFKNAKKLPEVVKEMPLDLFLLETDAPYLAPAPFRGKINNSSLIYYSAEKIGDIKGISAEAVLNHALENTKRLYNI
ncbi:MAG: TatD family hydrolase [Clostridia bacterium]|nr:TatD family hydrolase [Clostridia bacterium]